MGRPAGTSIGKIPQHGQVIIHRLNEMGKNQKWLALQCGVTDGMVNHVVTGYALPSLPVALKLAKALSSTVDEIFCDAV